MCNLGGVPRGSLAIHGFVRTIDPIGNAFAFAVCGGQLGCFEIANLRDLFGGGSLGCVGAHVGKGCRSAFTIGGGQLGCFGVNPPRRDLFGGISPGCVGAIDGGNQPKGCVLLGRAFARGGGQLGSSLSSPVAGSRGCVGTVDGIGNAST